MVTRFKEFTDLSGPIKPLQARWSRVRISPDPPSITKPRFCGAFSFAQPSQVHSLSQNMRLHDSIYKGQFQYYHAIMR